MEQSLKYYADDGTLTEFVKYMINTFGIARNNKTGKVLRTCKSGKYNMITVYENSGKRRSIFVGRALASTFIGPPPTLAHTADHKNKNPNDDTLDNIRWLCKKGQRDNQTCSKTKKDAFIIVKDGVEKTACEWVEHIDNEKTRLGREYIAIMFSRYARKKLFGFSYKEYRDLPEEVWVEIIGSKTIKGRWEVSNMNRVKYITNHAENVISGDRLGLDNGYPFIKINGKRRLCHILIFQSFFPEEYANKKPEEIILHENDDKLDFRPHKLRIGTRSKNATDAHDNGKHEGKRSSRMGCASYVNGILEKEHVSQRDAARYLKTIGFYKATIRGIGKTLNGDQQLAYGRTWKKI